MLLILLLLYQIKLIIIYQRGGTAAPTAAAAAVSVSFASTDNNPTVLFFALTALMPLAVIDIWTDARDVIVVDVVIVANAVVDDDFVTWQSYQLSVAAGVTVIE